MPPLGREGRTHRPAYTHTTVTQMPLNGALNNPHACTGLRHRWRVVSRCTDGGAGAESPCARRKLLLMCQKQSRHCARSMSTHLPQRLRP
jgi:hypothetical protein